MNLPFDLRALWERALARYNGYSPRDRRIILGVLVALGLSIVYVGVVEPILDYRKDAKVVAAQRWPTLIPRADSPSHQPHSTHQAQFGASADIG